MKTELTEKQKMLAGNPYNSRDPELLEMYHQAKEILLNYNHLNSRETNKKEILLEKLLGTIGKNTLIEAPFYCDYGELIFIGHNCFIHPNCVFIDSNTIIIGDNTLIGPSVQIYTTSHPLQAEKRIIKDSQDAYKISFVSCSSPIHIGKNSWIGGNVTILPGVTIGDNCTIGAGSMVDQDIPDNSLAIGNPCQVVANLLDLER